VLLTVLSPILIFVPRLTTMELHRVRLREREAPVGRETWRFHNRQRLRDLSNSFF